MLKQGVPRSFFACIPLPYQQRNENWQSLASYDLPEPDMLCRVIYKGPNVIHTSATLKFLRINSTYP